MSPPAPSTSNPFPTLEAEAMAGATGAAGPTAGTGAGATGRAAAAPATGQGAAAATGAGAPGRSPVMQRVVQGAHEAIDRAAESAAPHVGRLEESLAAAGGDLHHRADRAREIGHEWTESLRTTVREHPIASLAVALAVGMLLARAAR